MPSRSAALRASARGRTLKPITIASEAAASITSDSVIPPGAAWMTSTAIRSCGSLAISSWSASREPETSALSTTLSPLTSPSVALERTSSRLTLRACWRASDSAFRRCPRCWASWRAPRPLAAPFLGAEPLRGELVANPVGLGVRLVDLVDRDQHRHPRCPGVVDRLHRLRHHAVIGGDHDHRQVGDLRAARAHRRERLVAGRVDEGHGLAVVVDLVGADVLRDPARLPGHHLGLPDRVQQRGLAVVDAAPDRDPRGAVGAGGGQRGEAILPRGGGGRDVGLYPRRIQRGENLLAGEALLLGDL